MGLLKDIASSIDIGGDRAGKVGPTATQDSVGISADIPYLGEVSFSDVEETVGGMFGQDQGGAQFPIQPPQGPQNSGPSGTGPSAEGPTDQPPAQQGGGMMGMMGGGGFTGALMLEMLEDSIDSEYGRAILEAITSGAIQNGVIQQVTQVNTPRGTRNVSPPGYRTVYVSDEPYAVFKPLAAEMGLLPNESRKTMKQKMDSCVREYNKWRRYIKDVAPKAGLKAKNRKGGPKR